MKLNRTVRVGPAAVYTIETGRVLPGVAATMAPDDVVSIGVDTAKGESFRPAPPGQADNRVPARCPESCLWATPQ